MEGSSKELGQGLIEYAFLFLLVVALVFAALQIFGISVLGLYEGFVPLIVETFS